ncbi:hypothetical protein CXB51_028881 [Gossypium anomalum]|uniref:RNase H type-1 domain-containing protein n=1 Tax=Gossypium anomalum TaxID=47600 RepID=A0A8J5XYP9_9ROSI|nr:hypothetical protein CXB51_028881 [Gossypium anomalum]
MAQVKWKQICLPKEKGGAGVVDIRVKNKSLMAKRARDSRWIEKICGEKLLLRSMVPLHNIGDLERAFESGISKGVDTLAAVENRRKWCTFFSIANSLRDFREKFLNGGRWNGAVCWFWCPPSVGWVKFNVYGVEIEAEVECGGVLRDSNGVARALFFGPFAVKDSFAAEVVAISMALDVFLAMGWKGKSSLIIEVGSIEVFSWVENKGSRSWLLYTFFKEIEIRLSRVGNVSFSKVDKHCNKMAFALAVAGLKRSGMFKAWW